MDIPKLDMKQGIVVSLIGICIVFFGAYVGQQYTTIRLAGVIVATAGLVVLGKRVYERARELSRHKHKKY